MSSASRRVKLQGPRPQPLTVAKGSHHIKKPVIIHLRSPEIIHARPQEFMSLVQRLTGNGKSSNSNRSSTDSTSSPDDQINIISERGMDQTREGAGESDPLLLTLAPKSVLSPSPALSPSFFLFSPSTNDCLQEIGLLF